MRLENETYLFYIKLLKRTDTARLPERSYLPRNWSARRRHGVVRCAKELRQNAQREWRMENSLAQRFPDVVPLPYSPVSGDFTNRRNKTVGTMPGDRSMVRWPGPPPRSGQLLVRDESLVRVQRRQLKEYPCREPCGGAHIRPGALCRGVVPDANL